MAWEDLERKEPDPRIAQILTTHREATGMTRAQLAERAGLYKWTIIKIETGQRGVGTTALGKLGRVLGPGFEHEMLGVLSGED